MTSLSYLWTSKMLGPTNSQGRRLVWSWWRSVLGVVYRPEGGSISAVANFSLWQLFFYTSLTRIPWEYQIFIPNWHQSIAFLAKSRHQALRGVWADPIFEYLNVPDDKLITSFGKPGTILNKAPVLDRTISTLIGLGSVGKTPNLQNWRCSNSRNIANRME